MDIVENISRSVNSPVESNIIVCFNWLSFVWRKTFTREKPSSKILSKPPYYGHKICFEGRQPISANCCILYRNQSFDDRISSLFFSDFLHEIRIQWSLKSDSLFLRKCFAQTGVNGLYLGPKLTLLNFSLNLFIRFFETVLHDRY